MLLLLLLLIILENHRLEVSYENNLIVKLVLVSFLAQFEKVVVVVVTCGMVIVVVVSCDCCCCCCCCQLSCGLQSESNSLQTILNNEDDLSIIRVCVNSNRFIIIYASFSSSSSTPSSPCSTSPSTSET